MVRKKGSRFSVAKHWRSLPRLDQRNHAATNDRRDGRSVLRTFHHSIPDNSRSCQSRARRSAFGTGKDWATTAGLATSTRRQSSLSSSATASFPRRQTNSSPCPASVATPLARSCHSRLIYPERLSKPTPFDCTAACYASKKIREQLTVRKFYGRSRKHLLGREKTSVRLISRLMDLGGNGLHAERAEMSGVPVAVTLQSGDSRPPKQNSNSRTEA